MGTPECRVRAQQSRFTKTGALLTDLAGGRADGNWQ
jgi:hypothetical protein